MAIDDSLNAEIAQQIQDDIEKSGMSLDPKSLPIHETLHDGIYTRTVTIPEGMTIVGGLMKKPTTLIIYGKCDILDGDSFVEIDGFAQFATNAGRKNVFITKSKVIITALLRTNAQSCEEAVKEIRGES